MGDLIPVRGILLASRIPNLGIIAMAQYLSATMITRHNTERILDLNLLLLVISTVLVAAGGYIINDYYDTKIDMVNRPTRVVIGKFISRRKALITHTLFSLLAVVIGWLVSWQLALIHFCTISLLWYYSNHLRRYFIGKIVIAILTVVSILLVGFVFQIVSYRLMAFAAFGGSIIWIRELVKDLENDPGERMFGVESVPKVWGVRGTKLMISVIGAVGLGMLIYFMLKVNSQVFFLYYLCLSPVIALFAFGVYRSDRQDHFKRLRHLTNFIILAGLFSMLVI